MGEGAHAEIATVTDSKRCTRIQVARQRPTKIRAQGRARGTITYPESTTTARAKGLSCDTIMGRRSRTRATRCSSGRHASMRGATGRGKIGVQQKHPTLHEASQHAGDTTRDGPARSRAERQYTGRGDPIVHLDVQRTGPARAQAERKYTGCREPTVHVSVQRHMALLRASQRPVDMIGHRSPGRCQWYAVHSRARAGSRNEVGAGRAARLLRGWRAVACVCGGRAGVAPDYLNAIRCHPRLARPA